MRTLHSNFRYGSATLETVLKETKEVRVFRRAQAVREVVKGQRLQNVSDALQLPILPCANGCIACHQGVQGLVDRPRPGRPAKVTCELESTHRLIDQTPWSTAPSLPMELS